MNLAYIHLLLNHLPIVGIPIAVAFLVFGLAKKNVPTQRFSLIVLCVLAAVAVPVYLTGEPAEHLIENMPGIGESVIESHEDAAMYSLVLSLATGAIAFLALFFPGETKQSRTINFCVIFVGVIAIVSLAFTANLGGQIRHSEFDKATSSQPRVHENDNDD